MKEHNEEPPRILSGDADAPNELRRALEALRDEPDPARIAAIAARAKSSAGPGTGGGWSGLGMMGIASAVLVVGSAIWWTSFEPIVPESQAPSAEVPAREAMVFTPAAAQPTVPPTDEARPQALPAPQETVAQSPAKARAPRATKSRGVVTQADAGLHVDEARLLLAARRALESNVARALAMVEEHRRRYPRSALAEERDVLAIEAVSRSGNMERARVLATRFAANYPRSIHSETVRRLISAQ